MGALEELLYELVEVLARQVPKDDATALREKLAAWQSPTPSAPEAAPAPAPAPATNPTTQVQVPPTQAAQ